MIDGQAKDERADARSPAPGPTGHLAARRGARLASGARQERRPWRGSSSSSSQPTRRPRSSRPPRSRGRAGCSRSWASAVVLLFGLYPDGRFTPRWIVVPVSIEIALQAINVASGFSLEAQPWWPWHFLVTLGVTLLGGQVYRYRRRSSVDEREQTRWPLLAVLAMVFAYTLWAIVAVGLGLRPGARTAVGRRCSRCSRESASHSACWRRAASTSTSRSGGAS